MSIFDNSSDSGMKDLATWLQLLNQISKNQDTSAQDLRVFNMEKSTNDQVSSMIDGLTNEEQFTNAAYIVDNNIANASNSLHSQTGAQENINKYEARVLQNNTFNAFMEEADNRITAMDSGAFDWTNFTISDYANGFTFYNNFKDATTELSSQTQSSTGQSQTTTKPLNFTYKSSSTGRDHNMIGNRLDEFKGNLDTALVAFRNDGIIDDNEAAYVILGDTKGLEGYMKSSVIGTVNSIKFNQKRYSATETVLNNYKSFLVKHGVREQTDEDYGIHHKKLIESLSTDALFTTFKSETTDQDSEVFGQDASSKQSDDFKNFIDSMASKAANLSPAQFEADMTTKLHKFNGDINKGYKRFKFLTATDYNADAFSLKAQLTPMINQLMISTRGEGIKNPWIITMDDAQGIDNATIGDSNTFVENSEFREGESYYAPEYGFFKIGTQEDIDAQLKQKIPTTKTTTVIDRDEFIPEGEVESDNSLINIAKGEGINTALNILKNDTITTLKEQELSRDSTLLETEAVEDAIVKFNKQFGTTISDKAQLEKLWNAMTNDEKKPYGNFAKFFDAMKIKYNLK